MPEQPAGQISKEDDTFPRTVRVENIDGVKYRFEKVECDKQAFRSEVKNWMARTVLGRFDIIVNHWRVSVENTPANGRQHSNKSEEVESIIVIDGEHMTLDGAEEKVWIMPMRAKKPHPKHPDSDIIPTRPKKKLPRKAAGKKIPRYRG